MEQLLVTAVLLLVATAPSLGQIDRYEKGPSITSFQHMAETIGKAVDAKFLWIQNTYEARITALELQHGKDKSEIAALKTVVKDTKKTLVGVEVRVKTLETRIPRVNGVLSSWSAFTACSKSCGPGTQIRTRTCTPPLYGGKPCAGSLKDTRNCQTQQCDGYDTLADGNRYRLYKNKKNYRGAVKACNADGARLAQMNTEETQAAVEKMYTDTNNIWIDLTRPTNSGAPADKGRSLFRWGDGSKPFSSPDKFSLSGGADFCVRLRGLESKRWFDAPCGMSYYYLCQKVADDDLPDWMLSDEEELNLRAKKTRDEIAWEPVTSS